MFQPRGISTTSLFCSSAVTTSYIPRYPLDFVSISRLNIVNLCKISSLERSYNIFRHISFQVKIAKTFMSPCPSGPCMQILHAACKHVAIFFEREQQFQTLFTENCNKTPMQHAIFFSKFYAEYWPYLSKSIFPIFFIQSPANVTENFCTFLWCVQANILWRL